MKDNEQQGKKRKRKELSQQWMSIMKGKREKEKAEEKKKREIRKQHVAQDGGEIKKTVAIFYII